MKRLVGFGVLCAAFAVGAETLAFMGDSDKNPISYALNETITFTVKLVDKDAANAVVGGKELRWTLSGDDKTLDKSGTASSDAPLTVTTALTQPGFVRLKVEAYENDAKLGDSKMVFDGGAGADVMNIPEWPEPADFREFWTTATNTLYATQPSGTCTNFTPSGANADVEYFLYEFAVPGDARPATGILAKPRGATPGSCGIIARVYGYGFGATPIPSAGEVTAGNIVLHCTRHGEYPVHPDQSYYDTTVKNEMTTNGKGFCFRNNDTGDARDTDYYKMVMRDLRAIQYAKSLPEWNGEFLKTTGGSMGGWQAIACAALDCDVTECSASIPWSADLAAGVKQGRMTGWRPDWTASLDYVDLKNLAKLVACPVTFSAGLGDYVCPPSGQILLFKNLPEPKKVTFTQNMGHGSVYGPNAGSYTMQLPVPPPPPRMLKWVGGGANKLFSNPLNWIDTEGNTNAVPRSGDTISIETDTGSARNDIPNFYPQQLRLTAYQAQSALGEPLIFTASSGGIYNEGFLHYDFPTALVGTNVTFYSSSTAVGRGRLYSLDGSDCGIVKTGSQRAGINGGSVSDPAMFAGFRFVEIRQGEWIYGINGGSASKMAYLPDGQTITFAAANTKLAFATECDFKDCWVRETGAAVGGNHAIKCQVDDNGKKVYYAKLTISGTPPVDSMPFTGTFETAINFCWNPGGADKEFVIIGKNSTTTGGLEVAHGTVRVTDGATFSQMGELRLSGGAESTFRIDDVPSAPFNAASLVLATGNENLVLASGVTITVGGATVGGARVAPATYTAANCTWVKGAGAVVVLGRTNHTLTWAKRATYSNLNWSNPQNWINESTGLNDVPVDGDTIKLPGQTAYNAGGASGRTDANKNDLVNFRPAAIHVQDGYSNPRGNPVIFDGDSPGAGIYNRGFMYYSVPTIVNRDEIVMDVASHVGHQGDIYSTDGHEFTIRKTGGGHFALQTKGSNTYAGLKRVNVEGGQFAFGWQDYGTGDAFPDGLTFNFAARDTHMKFSKFTTLRDFVLTESGNAVNNPHYIGLAQGDNKRSWLEVAFTGTPALKSQVFTGVVQSGIALKWAVDDPECELVFSGALSANVTTNSITVTNGTVRLTSGATFTQLGVLSLTSGAGARFAVDAPPAQPFRVKELVLETGDERLFIVGGAKIAADKLTVGGVELPAGVYSAAGNIATAADWIEGGGFLCVGGADAEIPVSSETTAANWTANGGSDTAVGTAANWGAVGNATLPDLESGSLVATFAAGAKATLDRRAAFRGLELDAPGAFEFASGADVGAFIGADGVTTAGTGRNYDFAWPAYLTGPQAWTVGAGDTLNVNGTLNGGDKLVFLGDGTVNLNGASNFGGKVTVSNKVMNVNADDAFGASGSNPVEVNFMRTTFNLNGVTLNRTLKNLGEGILRIPNDTDNVIDGDCDFSLDIGTVTVKFGAGASLRVKGSWKRGTTYWNYFNGESASRPGTLRLDGPMHMIAGSANGLNGNVTAYFNAQDNDCGGVWFWLQNANNRMYTTVPYAFRKSVNGHRTIIRADGTGANNVLDLCGNDQEVTAFGANANVKVTSEVPAVFHVVRDRDDYVANVATNRACWAGAAGLSFEGTKFMCLGGASTSTGVVQVTQGRLEFLSGATWSGASAVVVKGGELVCRAKNVFGETTALDLASGGVMNLGYAGTMKVASLTVDGEEMPAGYYGGPASPAANKLACFSGMGVVTFGVEGTIFILR